VVGTDAARDAGPGRLRRIGLLAVLLALIVPMATTATTTAPPATDAVATVHQAANGGNPSTGLSCGGVENDDSDTLVRVVKKARGVFLPHGLTPPTFAAADAPPRHDVPLADQPAPRAALPIHTYPRRGPPAIRVHPSP
jgi:hypothetical protein